MVSRNRILIRSFKYLAVIGATSATFLQFRVSEKSSINLRSTYEISSSFRSLAEDAKDTDNSINEAPKVEPLTHESNSEDLDSDMNAQSNVTITLNVSDIEDEEIWKEKSESCGFCKFFIESPCAEQFKYWSTCVDRAKAADIDFKSACDKYTSALFECSGSHQEYFDGPSSNKESDDCDEDSHSESTVEEDTKEIQSQSPSEISKDEKV